MVISRPHLFIFICFITISCSLTEEKKVSGLDENYADFDFMNDTLIELTELQSCDILVKPNHNWLYGSSFVSGGSGFGHAVLVIEGAEGTDAMSVLQKAKIFESQAHRVPDEYQLRLAPGYHEGDDFRWANTNFGEQNKGFRYRLRLPLTNTQKDSIIRFVLKQDTDISGWRSQKVLDGSNPGNSNLNTKSSDKKIWYCSLLIWQAFYSVLGIDIDCNGGLMVYPNDLVNSNYFENNNKCKKNRVRF